MTTDTRSAADEPGNVRDLIRPILQRKWWILAAVVIATVGTYLYSSSKEKEYTGAAILFLQTTASQSPLSTASSMPPTDRNADNQARLVTSRPVLEAAARRLQGQVTLGELIAGVRAAASEGSDFINVTGTSRDATKAARMANAAAVEFVAARNARLVRGVDEAIAKTRAALKTLPKNLSRDDPRFPRQTALNTRLQQLLDTKALPANDVSVTSYANPPSRPSSPKPKRDALFALVLALVAALAVAFGLERFDRRVKTVDDAVDAFGRELLAVIPHVDDAAPALDGNAVLGTGFRESFRGLRTNLRLAALDGPIKTLMVTSAIPGEGKSTTVRNLAITYREWGLRVAVVEMDLRRPSLARLFHVAPDSGLLELLSGERTFEQAVNPVPVKVEGLQTLARIEAHAVATASNGNGDGSANGHGDLAVIAEDGVVLLQAGSRAANPEAILATERVRALLSRLSDAFDIVLIDTAPLLAVSDAVPIAQCVDGVILVTRFGLTTRDEARRLSEYMNRIPGANVLGVVANDLPRGEASYGYYGGGAYGDDDDPRRP